MRIAILLVLILAGATPLLCQENPEVIWQRLQSSDDKDEQLYRFSIPPQGDGSPPRTVEAWMLTTEIDWMEIVSDRLVVRGSYGGMAATITVIDLKQPEKYKNFFTWYPELSNTKRYLLYTGWWGRFYHPYTSTVVGVFDVLGSLEDAPSDERTRYGRLSNTLQSLGQPVYPVLNARRRTFERGIDGLYHHAPEYVRWFASDRGLVFLDQAGPQYEPQRKRDELQLTVVVVCLAENYGDPVIREHRLSSTQKDLFLDGTMEMRIDQEAAAVILELKGGGTFEAPLGECPGEPTEKSNDSATP